MIIEIKDLTTGSISYHEIEHMMLKEARSEWDTTTQKVMKIITRKDFNNDEERDKFIRKYIEFNRTK